MKKIISIILLILLSSILFFYRYEFRGITDNLSSKEVLKEYLEGFSNCNLNQINKYSNFRKTLLILKSKEYSKKCTTMHEIGKFKYEILETNESKKESIIIVKEMHYGVWQESEYYLKKRFLKGWEVIIETYEEELRRKGKYI